MARRARQESAHDAHHVTARCLDGRLIVHDRDDVDELLGALAGVVRERGWTVATYCVMPNHYHMVVWTPNADLGAGMKGLQEGFAHYANERDGLRGRGHFWSERFHNVPLPTDDHLVARLRYDARNPVKHGFTDRPEDWPYSAHLALLGERPAPAWLDVERVLAVVGGREAYRAVVDRDDARLVAGLVDALGEHEAVRRAIDVHDVPVGALANHLGCSRTSVYRRARKARSAERRVVAQR